MYKNCWQHIASLTMFILFVGTLLLPSSALGQTPPPTTAADQLGMQPYQTYVGGEVDYVNLANGNLSVDSPIVNYRQRGKVRLDFHQYYGQEWQHFYEQIITDPNTGLNNIFRFWGPSPSGRYAPNTVFVDAAQRVTIGGYQNCEPVNNQNWCSSNFAVYEMDGAEHPLGNLGTQNLVCPSNNCGMHYSGPWESIDVSGWHVNGQIQLDGSFGSAWLRYAPNSIVDPDGVTYPQSGVVFEEDSNGNTINFNNSTYTDSLGRNISVPPTGGTAANTTTSNCPQPPQVLLPVDHAVLWSPPGPAGSSNYNYIFCYSKGTINIPADTTFGVQPYAATTFTFLQSIVLPNGQSWDFQYNDPGDGSTYNGSPVNYGTLTQVKLPAGGTISYKYSTRWLNIAIQNGGRYVVSRTVNANDGTGPYTWNYIYSAITSGSNQVGTLTQVTDPQGNYSKHTFDNRGHEITTQMYSADGTLQKTLQISFGSNGYLPDSITTSWPNGQTATLNRSYDTGFVYTDPFYIAGNVTGRGSYGKVLTESNYDYGGALLRQTNITYMAFSGPNATSYFTNNLLSLPYTVQVTNGSGTQAAFTQYNYDETSLSSSGLSSNQQFDPAPSTGIYRGNNTSTLRWLNSGSLTCPDGSSGGSGSNLISRTTYFNTGTIRTLAQPCDNVMTYAYSPTYWASFPTTITNALNQSTNHSFDLNTGLINSSTDANNQTITFQYDSMLRPLSINYPDGGQTTISYDDVAHTITASKKINTSLMATTVSLVDGMGRVKQTQLTSDPQGTVYTDTTYDGLGRVASVSNPYRSGTDVTTSSGITAYAYDALGRKISETYPDGAVLQTAFCGSSTLVTDPTGRWRRSRTDGLGRLVEVDEPNAPGASVASTGCPGTGESIWVTSYTNDVLGDLMQVVQNGSHARTFTYDSLSRLLTSTNPEVGTITYTYDADGNIATKKDSRNITTTYAYDVLNRTTGATYSNGDPSVAFTYDQANCLGLSSPCQNIGQRTSMTDAAGSESWAYKVDASNQRNVHVNQRTTSGITKTSTYVLDFVGNITQITYPTGRVVNYTYNGANRPITAADGSSGITYATGFQTPPANTNCVATAVCYTPQGTYYALSVGQSSAFTGLNLNHSYNTRFQPLRFSASLGALANASVSATWTWNFGLKRTAIDFTTLSPTNVSVGESITASGWTPSFINGTYSVTNVSDTTHFRAYLVDGINHGSGTNASGNVTFVPNIIDISYSFTEGGTSNAGHVNYIFNNLDATRTQYFTYDQLNRVTSSQTFSTFSSNPISPAHCWGETYTLDAWANLLSIASTTNSAYTGCSQESGFTKTADGNNHVSGFTYDTSGNTTNDGTYTYVWDGESQLKSANGVNYLYDGSGRRVSKSNGKLYWYGSGGEILAETNSAGTTTAEYVFFGGQRIAMIPAGSTPNYYVEDMLGTSRVVTTATGTLCYDADFYPYGGERAYTNACTQNYKFEGKERDTETSNDDFGARYYSNRFGRWLSADWSAVPAPVPYANLSNPQTLNLYAMVHDDPESFADLDGHETPGPWFARHPGQRVPDVSKTEVKVEVGIIASAAAFIGGAELGVATIARNILGWALATAPITVPIIIDAVDGYVNPGAGGTLTIARGQTKLSAEEIDTGVRLAKQTGEALAQGTHVGEEFIDSLGRTYDAVSTGKGNTAKILENIKTTAQKSVDFVAVDLKGASKEMLKTIKNYVKNDLTKAQQQKIKYVNP